MKMNDDKSNILMFGGKEEAKIKITSYIINESQSGKLLGVILSKNLNFK